MNVTVSVRHEKAMQLLQDLADLNLIDLLPADPPAAEPSTPPDYRRSLDRFRRGRPLSNLINNSANYARSGIGLSD